LKTDTGSCAFCRGACYLKENLPQYHSVHHNSYTNCAGVELKPQRQEVGA